MRLTKPIGAAIAGAFVGLLLAIIGAVAILLAGSRLADGEPMTLAGLELLTSESTPGAGTTQVSLALTATAMALLIGLVVVSSVAGYLLSAARQRRVGQP